MFGNLVAGVQAATAEAANNYADTQEALKVLSKETQSAIKGLDRQGLIKAGRIVKHLKTSDIGGGFESEDMDMIINALYVTKSDEDLHRVFDMLYKKIVSETGQCRVSLKMSCEKLYDVRKMEIGPSNPQLIIFKRADDPYAVKQFQEVAGHSEVIMDTRKPKFKTPIVLDYDPDKEQHIRIRIVNSLDGEALSKNKRIYDDWEHLGQFETNLNVIAKAKGEVTGKLAAPERGVDTLTHVKQGTIKIQTEPVLELTAEHFKKVLPLVGEGDVEQEHVDRLFYLADEDGSGMIEFEEFKKLMLAMNPDGGQENDLWDVDFRRNVENTPYAMSTMVSLATSLILPEIFERWSDMSEIIVDKYDVRIQRGALSGIQAEVVSTYNSRTWEDEELGRLAQFEMDVDFFGYPDMLLRMETEGTFQKDLDAMVTNMLVQAQMQVTMQGLSRAKVSFLKRPKVELEVTVVDKKDSSHETKLLENFLTTTLAVYGLSNPYDVNLRLHDVLGF